MCVCLGWEAQALHRAAADGRQQLGVQRSGMEEQGSGRRLCGEAFPKVMGELWGCGWPTGELPLLQALDPLPLSLHSPGTPKGSLCGEVAQLRSVKQPDSSATCRAHGHLCVQPCFSSCWISTQKCVQCDLSLQLPSGWLCRDGLWGFSFPHYTQ